MLFFIYLISVAISVVVIYETTISFSKKMEKDGFLFVNKKSFWMQFKDYVSLIFKVCFPIANIFMFFVCCLKLIIFIKKWLHAFLWMVKLLLMRQGLKKSLFLKNHVIFIRRV